MAQSPSTGSDDPDGITNIKDVCTAWAQKKYGSEYTVESVKDKHLKVIPVGNINYGKSEEKSSSVTRSDMPPLKNPSGSSIEREFSYQSTEKFSCGFTKTKGTQFSGGLSVNVALPAAAGLSAKIGGQIQLSNTKTDISETVKTSTETTTIPQRPWSILLVKKVTTRKVITHTYTRDLRLAGKVSITLQNANGKTKTKVDVVDLYPEGKVETDAKGKKSVLLTEEWTRESTIEEHEVMEIKEPDAEKLMQLIHGDLLNDNRQKIAKEVSDKQAMDRLLEVMSAEQVVSEEQLETVKEGVDNLVSVLENAEPEKFLAIVNSLQRKGCGKLVELLDPRPIYLKTNSLKTISNLSKFGVVDHYFVTKKVSEVKDTLERTRRVIAHGMPGSGKTQLAYKVAGDYVRVHPHSVVWVIDGSSEEKLNDGIANLRHSLSGETNVDNSLFQSLVSRWKHFLLLINDLSPTVAIPTQVLSSSAKLIVTTQDSLIELDDVENIPIEGFTEDEAVKFLTPQMPPGTSTEQMRDLANIFSCLPLGLAAARASIHRGNMTVEGYKQQLQGGREALEVLMRREDNWLQQHYKKEHQEAARNIFAALQLAIDKLDDPEEEKMCKVMLQPCAFLDPNNIPVLMLKSALKSSPTIGSEDLFTERMRMYSLGSIEGEGVKRRLSIHGVTQMAIHLHMDKEQQTTCINRLLQILVKFFLKDMMTYSGAHKFSLKLMPHVKAVLKHADELKLGPEYPLMKARLLMVYGHLLIQKGAPASSQKHMKEAEKLLLQFADIPEDILSTKGEKELYQKLADKSQSLEDNFFEETVIRRVITKQHLSAVSDKLGPEHRTTSKLESMMENFEPLTMEMYNTLVDSNLAIPLVKLKGIFLPELYISILYTLWKAYEDDDDDLYSALELCTVVTNETDVSVLVHILADSEMRSRQMLDEDLDEDRSIFDQPLPALPDTFEQSKRFDNAFKFVFVLAKIMESLLLDKMMVNDAATRFYDFGLLTSVDGDTCANLNYYEKVLTWCIKAEKGEKSGIISKGQEVCNKMLELAESESQAGKPPLKLSKYYITAGRFNAVVNRKLDEAAHMFRKAYRVELKREEYHPRMVRALACLFEVRMKQKELGRARVCARRLLQLAKDHYPVLIGHAENFLRIVCCKIIVQGKLVTTV